MQCGNATNESHAVQRRHGRLDGSASSTTAAGRFGRADVACDPLFDLRGRSVLAAQTQRWSQATIALPLEVDDVLFDSIADRTGCGRWTTWGTTFATSSTARRSRSSISPNRVDTIEVRCTS